MGGDGPTTFDRVIEFGDGWLPISRGSALPDGLADKIVDLRRRAEAAGRDADAISVSLFSAPLDKQFVEAAIAAGVNRIIFNIRPLPQRYCVAFVGRGGALRVSKLAAFDWRHAVSDNRARCLIT